MAAAAKKPTQVQVQLSLTKSQLALVLRAENLARDKARPAHQQVDTTQMANTSTYDDYLKGTIDPRD
jgi:hypothetical protein